MSALNQLPKFNSAGGTFIGHHVHNKFLIRYKSKDVYQIEVITARGQNKVFKQWIEATFSATNTFFTTPRGYQTVIVGWGSDEDCIGWANSIIDQFYETNVD